MKSKIIEFPTMSKKEKIGGIILVLLYSIIGGLFFIKDDPVFPFFIIFGLFFFILLFNVLTNGKFDILSTIKNSKKYIEFNDIGLNYSGKIIEWKKLKKIKISLKCYKGKRKPGYGEHRGNYYGYEVNYIEYEFKGTKKKHFFYIENREKYLLLKNHFKTTVLPIIYRFKNIRNENILVEKLEYKELQEFKKMYDIKAVYDEIIFN